MDRAFVVMAMASFACTIPIPVLVKGQLFGLISDWVEKGMEPGRVVFTPSALTGIFEPASIAAMVCQAKACWRRHHQGSKLRLPGRLTRADVADFQRAGP